MSRRSVFAGYLVALAAILTFVWLCYDGIVVWRKKHIDRIPILDVQSEVNMTAQESMGVMDVRIPFANTGGGVLILDQFRTLCSCDHLEIEIDNNVFPATRIEIFPFQRGVIRLRQQIQARPGEPFQSPIRFRSNDPNQPEALVLLKIENCIGGIETVPTAVHFGFVLTGTKHAENVDIFDRAAIPRQITEVVSSDPERIRVTLLPCDPKQSKATDQRHIARLQIEIHEHQSGPLNSHVLIKLNDESQPFKLSVYGKMIPVCEAIPSTIRVISQNLLPDAAPIRCLLRANGKGPVLFRVILTPDGVKTNVVQSNIDSSTAILSIHFAGLNWPISDHPLKIQVESIQDNRKSLMSIPIAVIQDLSQLKE